MSKENSDFIRNIKAYDFNDYSGVSSREKLVVFSIKFLTDHNIPTTFDYVCMTAFKFFPEEFKLSDEFPEQADIAGLNRTLMHLRPGERDLASGKPNTEYVLNENGLAWATQVQEGLENKVFKTTDKQSKHDKVVEKKNKEKYLNLINNNIYKVYIETNLYRTDLIWRLFKVAPFTKMDVIMNEIKEIKIIAKNEDDKSCLELCLLMEDDVRKLMEKRKMIVKGVQK